MSPGQRPEPGQPARRDWPQPVPRHPGPPPLTPSAAAAAPRLSGNDSDSSKGLCGRSGQLLAENKWQTIQHDGQSGFLSRSHTCWVSSIIKIIPCILAFWHGPFHFSHHLPLLELYHDTLFTVSGAFECFLEAQCTFPRTSRDSESKLQVHVNTCK